MSHATQQAIGYEYYRDLWENPQPAAILSCPARWDERADEWVKMLAENAGYRARTMERIEATTCFLRQNGLLAPGSHVLDIGCGPGLFSAAFAKTAAHVTGVDISPRMVHHAKEYARRQGTPNTAFVACNFKQKAAAGPGWHKKFDLVMSCLTPAVTGVADLHKMMEISRGHCLHVSFASTGDSLEDAIAARLYKGVDGGAHHWDGRVFCAVFNLLFLEGYNPKTFYFTQSSTETLAANQTLARRYASAFKKEGPCSEKEVERILACLREMAGHTGELQRTTEECYGFILWDVNEKRGTRSGFA